MGTRTWTRRGVLTAAGRRRAGMVAQTLMSGDDIDKALADAMYPMEMQMNIYGGEDGIISLLGDDDPDRDSNRNYQALFDTLGLDPSNAEDVEILAGMLGAFGDNSGTDADGNIKPPMMNVRYREVNGYPTVLASYISAVAESTRIISVQDDRIVVINNTFINGNDAVEGQGIVMLLRQTAAARKLSERMGGKPVDVTVDALSSLDGEWIGAQVWPKMGYNFMLDRFNNPSIAEEAVRRGFQSKTTVELMTERNASGELGYDVWPSIVGRVLQDEDEVKLRGRMTPTNDADVGVQLMMEYGRKKSLVKEAMPPSAMNDIFYLTPADDQQLRNAWLSLASARG